VKNKTSIFEHQDGDWNKTGTMDIRQLDTVIINGEKKTALLNDVQSFLDPPSRAWYSQRGIPYRKGYLLYGPLGTGKSSLSFSIAGHYDLDIYILNLSTVNNSSLGKLFSELPARCVVLLEDIDAINATQSRNGTAKTKEDETGCFLEGESREKVSLSVLLNVLDGVGSPEGRVLIMTTNHIKRLDAALIRPGRVDMKLELGLADRDIIAQLCSIIFRCDNSCEGGEAEDEVKLKKLAEDFASKVPEREFSEAEVQSFLLEYRESLHIAVESAHEWIIRSLKEKGRITGAGPEGFCDDIPPNILTALDDIQAGEITSNLAVTTTRPTTPSTHCCSCQVLQDIRGNLKCTAGSLNKLPATPPGSPNLPLVATKLKFLDVQTAMNLSGDYEDAYSETSDDASSGTSFDLESESPGAEGSIVDQTGKTGNLLGKITTDSHCCSCQVLQDIRDVCARNEILSVHRPLPIQW
jgi:hypothetical protein